MQRDQSTEVGEYGMFIDGTHHQESDDFTVRDPATNETIATVTSARDEAVAQATTAANEALEEWKQYDPGERKRILDQIANLIRENKERLAEIDTIESGKPLSEAQHMTEEAANYYDYYAGWIDKIEGDTIPVPGERHAYTRREPIGVSAQIIPWNAALLLTARGVAPALACGNAVVIKPAPEAPLTILEFAKLVGKTDLPDGVLNVIPGGGRTGAALTEDDQIDNVVFTGSDETAKKVMGAAAKNLLPVGIECGGKSPSIVFPDADLDRAAEDTLKIFMNAGQVCFATTRVFIHEDIYDEFVTALVEGAEEITIGPGIEDPDLGALISTEARDAVADYVNTAEENGARVLTGGNVPREEGSFYAPTIVDNVADDAPLSCEEVFGPVFSTYEFSSEEGVIRRANDTNYGLYAAIWTNTLDRAHRIAHELEAGTVTVNEYPALFPQSPFGGYKQSGIGREKGKEAIHHYTQVKNVAVSLGEKKEGYFVTDS